MIEPLWKERAVLIKGESSIVVSDIHLGFELELLFSGVYIPDQTEKLALRVSSLGKSTGVRRLVVNGDLKHSIGISSASLERVNRFIEFVKGQFDEILVIKGNHDGGITEFSGVRVVDGRGTPLDDVWVFHGHATPPEESSRYKIGLMGHVHPTIRVRGFPEPVWVLAETTCSGLPPKVLIMPPFNELTGYGILNKLEVKGPIFPKCVDTEESYVLDLEGRVLGVLGELIETHKFSWRTPGEKGKPVEGKR